MIRVFSYSRESKRMETPSIAELPRHISDRGRMIWMDLEDPTDEETGVLSGIFGFHALAVEDCMCDNLLPKVDQYDGYMFMVVHAADASGEEEAFRSLEVDIFVGENYLVTYRKQYSKGLFDVRGHVAKNPGSLLRSPDWLLHGILNTIVDDYDPALQILDERTETLEEKLLASPEEEHINKIVDLKREVYHLNRIAVMQREIIHRMGRGDLSWIAAENLIYFRDIGDHLARIVQRADLYREMLTGAMETYLSVITSRTNRAVKTLAIVATVGMPLALIAGFYGMNFGNIPGLEWEKGPSVVLGAMALLALGILLVFKKKRWF